MPRSSGQGIAAAILIAFAALALVVPILALAGSSGDPAPGAPPAQYDTRAENAAQQPQAVDSGDGGIDNRFVGSVPLTGLDVMIVTAVAMALAAVAVAFRVLSRPRQPAEDLSTAAAPSPVLAVAEAQRSGLPPQAG